VRLLKRKVRTAAVPTDIDAVVKHLGVDKFAKR
jgi:hypothetical protein